MRIGDTTVDAGIGSEPTTGVRSGLVFDSHSLPHGIKWLLLDSARRSKGTLSGEKGLSFWEHLLGDILISILPR
jgi:hypothetical protein